MKKFMFPALFTLLLLLFSTSALALEKGIVAPDFELSTLEGKKVRLSDYKGQTIVLKLATTWCPTCKQLSQEIRYAGDYLKKNEVAVVEIFLQDTEEMVKEYFSGQTYEMPHVVLIDDGQVHKGYNVYLIPRLLLIDKDFKVRRDGSLISARDLVRELEKVAQGELQ